jgi:hypothetical protein
MIYLVNIQQITNTMKFLVGTSGYSYKEWKGTFYPAKLPANEMLAHYATQLPTVEINSTFRRFPTDQTVKAWAADTPESFRFVSELSQPAIVTALNSTSGRTEHANTRQIPETCKTSFQHLQPRASIQFLIKSVPRQFRAKRLFVNHHQPTTSATAAPSLQNKSPRIPSAITVLSGRRLFPRTIQPTHSSTNAPFKKPRHPKNCPGSS